MLQTLNTLRPKPQLCLDYGLNPIDASTFICKRNFESPYETNSTLQMIFHDLKPVKTAKYCIIITGAFADKFRLRA